MALQLNVKSTAEPEPLQNIRPGKDRSSERDVTGLTQATICQLSNIDRHQALERGVARDSQVRKEQKRASGSQQHASTLGKAVLWLSSSYLG